MKSKTWVILGATSIIAESFAHLAAANKDNLLLVARNEAQLKVISADIELRYKTACKYLVVNFSTNLKPILQWIMQTTDRIALFIAYSEILLNCELSQKAIENLIKVNITSTIQLIDAFLGRKQPDYQLFFLSSVAAARGRDKNSLYGASKAAIEIYLQGLQQKASPSLKITIARLGFIDTRQTYTAPNIFYAATPQACAKACWRAVKQNKRFFYYPFFWRLIMLVIAGLPFFIYTHLPR